MAEPIVTIATWLPRQPAASMWQMAVTCSRIAPQTIQSNLKRNIHRDISMSKVYKSEAQHYGHRRKNVPYHPSATCLSS